MPVKHPIDELEEKLDAGCTPTSFEITKADAEAVIRMTGCNDLLLPGKAWGDDAERGAITALARIIHKCGWATTAKKALDALQMVPAGWTGKVFPCETHPAIWDGDPRHKADRRKRQRRPPE